MSQERATDRISELPKDIVCSILNNLTVWDAFRASLASTRWTDISFFIRKLDFDVLSMFQLDSRGAAYDLDMFPISFAKFSPIELYADKFVKWVNHFLRFHKGLQIEFFRVRVTFAYTANYTCDLDKWVIFALSKGVRDLNLILWCESYERLSDRDSMRHSYLLRSELFSQSNYINQLTSLSLCFCRLEPGVCYHLRNLTSLKFSMTVISSDHLQAVLLSCSNLETLSLDRVREITYLRIPRSLNHLKFLLVDGCHEIKKIRIRASNLECLIYHVCQPQIVAFSRACRLKNISLFAFYDKTIRYTFGQLGSDIPQLESLSVRVRVDAVASLPEKITTFSRLKHLHLALTTDFTKFDALRIVNLLRACPLLEKLVLEVCTMYPEEEILPLPLEYGVHNCLKEVHIMGFITGRLHIEVASYILYYCVALERMVFEPVKRIKSLPLAFTRFKWDKSERAIVWSRLKDHRRSSLISMM